MIKATYKRDYDPLFHPKDLLKRMRNGELDIQVYAAWGHCKNTLVNWRKEYSELEDAYQIGIVACEAWWIAEMRKKWLAGDEKGFKYCALIVNTKFGYRENQSPSVTNNTQINVQGNMAVANMQSRTELADFITTSLEDPNIINVLGIENEPSKQD